MSMARDRIAVRLEQVEKMSPQLALVARAFRRALTALHQIDDNPYSNPDANAECAGNAIFEAAEILDDWRDE